MSVKNEVSTIVRNSVYECNKVIDGLDTIVHNLVTAFEISDNHKEVNDAMPISIYEALALAEKAQRDIRKANKILDIVKSKL